MFTSYKKYRADASKLTNVYCAGTLVGGRLGDCNLVAEYKSERIASVIFLLIKMAIARKTLVKWEFDKILLGIHNPQEVNHNAKSR